MSVARSIKRFFNPKFLQTIDLDLLRRFLSPHLKHLEIAPNVFDKPEKQARAALLDFFKTAENYPQEMMRDLHRIAELGNENGLHNLIDIAALHGKCLLPEEEIGDEAELRRLDPRHVAMRVYLEQPDLFQEASTASACRLPRTSFEYRGRSTNVPAKLDGEAKKLFVERTSEFFRKRLKGGYCDVAALEEDGVFLLVVKHGKTATTTLVEQRGEESVLSLRELALASMSYMPSSGVLSVMTQVAKERLFLRDLFAEALLGDKEFFKDAETKPIYTLQPIADRGASFRLAIEGIEGLKSAWVQEIQIQGKKAEGETRSVEGKMLFGNSTNAIGDLLRLAPNVDLRRFDIAHVKALLRFEQSGKKIDIPVIITPPCKLSMSTTGRMRFERDILRFLDINGFYADSELADALADAA